MGKYTDLIKNVGILTISNFGSKLLAFFLVPLYTAVLTTEEYGNFDFINTTISLLIPILTLNITEGALRFLLEKNNDENDICKISLKMIIISIIIVFCLTLINNTLNIIPILKNYWIYFTIYYIVFVLYQSAQNITRGFDKLKYIGVSGIINSAFMLGFNLLFLLVFKIGLDGYFLANILANFISTVYLFISIRIFKYLNFKKINKKLEKDMIKYSKPLMLNSIGWWINSVSDRYIVTFICGVAENGIYSVAYKIPSILSIIQTIFNQAWTLSAVTTFDKDDKDDFIRNIYICYNLLMVLCCSILIILTKILAKVLYMNDFFIAWKYMPFLMISVVFSAMSGILGGIFTAVKDTKAIGNSAFFSALINILLNIILVYKIGAIGAAIATLISCLVIWIVRYILSKKYVNLKINIIKDCIGYLLLVIQAILLLCIENNKIMYLVEVTIFLLIISINKKDLKIFMNKIKMSKFFIKKGK